MKTYEILIFFTGLLMPLAFCFRNLLTGKPSDNLFSEKTFKKLVVPKDSVLRKIIGFKEDKAAFTPFLYIRAIPYVVFLALTIVGSILIVINLLVENFIPGEIFFHSGFVMLGVYFAYEVILSILAGVFKL
ncbi:MAG: hypothetical protein IKC58_03800 [Clostridia bacterium]|nr:hypothetical protein [Clostridia bacterium]MBR2985702.1 hypothetical protein [Clostridia bacterium]